MKTKTFIRIYASKQKINECSKNTQPIEVKALNYSAQHLLYVVQPQIKRQAHNNLTQLSANQYNYSKIRGHSRRRGAKVRLFTRLVMGLVPTRGN